jgi:signal transduction histidine kinase
MNKKLLHKTQRIYLYILIVLFAVTATLFYFFIQKLYLQEIDETLILSKSEFLDKSISELTVNDISVWNKFNSRIQIQPDQNILKDTLFNQQYYNQLEQENEPFRELNSPIRIEGKSYTLSIKTSLLESDDLMTGVALFFVIILIILFTAILFINKLLSTRMWKPFYQTLQQIENFEIDKHHKTNLPDSDIMEFNQLNKSIENLIERSIAIYNNQREFIENAAHELQTPIAVFKAKLDDLMQRSDITNGQAEVLNSLNDATLRMNRLNKNLLLLSKLDKHAFSESETFSLKELVEKNLSFFIEQANSKSIDIITDLHDNFILNSNKSFIEIMFNNLLLNAVSHNIENGTVHILLADKKLIISNTGKNIALSTEKLFSRFSKINPSGNGNGLGLAIVKKICDLNQWQVTYTFSEEKHTFSIKFS